jgi:hypothetical protein
MLRIIWDIVIWLLLGAIATMLVILSFVFFLSVPDLLERLSYYIGDICTWIIFIFIILSIIMICIDNGR